MSTFDEREKGFENKYKRDQEFDFKVTARRNRLLGEWAAGEMGITGDAVADYAKEVVACDFEESGDDDVVRKVLGDLEAKGVSIDEHGLRRQMDKLMSTARDQLQAETD